MSRLKKLILKARGNPKGIKFNELCRLCELIGMAPRLSGGSHVMYKRSLKPIYTISIQNKDGMAKHYQVKQLLQFINEHGLLNEEE